DVLALLDGDVPVLDPQPAAVDRAVVLADVAGRPDAVGRGAQRRVAADPASIAELEAGGLGQHGVGHRPHTEHDGAAFDLEPALADHPLDPLARAGEVV